MKSHHPDTRTPRSITRLLLVLLAVQFAIAIQAPSAPASFGLTDLDTTFTDSLDAPSMQAGSHPFAWTTSVNVNTVAGKADGGAVKDVVVELPPGLVVNPTATPLCSAADFAHVVSGQPQCSDSTAVGIAGARGEGPGTEPTDFGAVYNLAPAPGTAAKLGFFVLGVEAILEGGVRPGGEHRLYSVSPNISQVEPILGARVTLWGNPADPLHDQLRGKCVISHGNCPVDTAEKAFLTLPTSCSGPLRMLFQADSWQNPDAWLDYEIESHDNSVPSSPLGTTGCAKLGFNPTIAGQPTTKAASSPTGLDFSLNVQDEGLVNPTGLAQSHVKKTVVTLPEGITANPSLAEGLNVCTEQDLARETASSAPGEGCPNESKIGTVEVETPLVEEPLKGSLYIAKPYANPFDSLLAIYFVFKNPNLGVVITQPAKVIPDPVTGQLVTVVEDIPQLPFSRFTLHFREGSRSPLVSPPLCGAYDAKAVLYPWAGGPPVTRSSTFQIISGPNNAPCPSGGIPPFAPGVTAGTLNNNAGSYSPFDLKITRKDGEQELTRFSTIMPPGLTGNLTGIPFCSDGAIEVARTKTGAQENTEPSCAAASQIGHTLVGAGVGGTLAWAPGKIYLAGPYHGAALSIVSITSATVGPFDLGTVVIRFALAINPITAQVEIDSAGSDPVPHIIQGIVVNVREVHAYVDREKFILNPTNCAPLSIVNTVDGAGADFTNPADQVPVTVSSRFQAADCLNLGFKPAFKVSTNGKTSRANGASLSVKLTYPKVPQGTQANIRSVKVDLPKQLPSRLTTLQKACPSTQFQANPAGCPPASVVGHATAITPILPVPLTGPAYFVSYGGAKFPELVIVLQGYGFTIDLHGETFISKAGITSSTFHTVPDQPVTSFELTLPQGKYSALAANGNLCKAKLKMPTTFTAQNGAVVKQSTNIQVSGCPRHKVKKAKAKGHRNKK
jgi:hypothetical protein